MTDNGRPVAGDARQERGSVESAERPIRLLHLYANAVPSAYFREIADRHDRTRYELTLGTLSEAGPLHADMEARGVRTFSLECKGRSDYPRALFSLVRWIRRERIDIVQVHLFDSCVVGLIAARLARVRLTIFTAHHTNDLLLHYDLRGAAKSFWLDTLLDRWLGDRVIAPSGFTRNALVSRQGIPVDRVAVVPYGIELGRLQPSAVARERVRGELGLGTSVVFGAVGRLHWIKDYPTMIQAFARLAREREDVTLLIVGDGPERANVEAVIDAEGMVGRVLLAGYRTDVPDILGAIDVFVHASLTESFNQALIEAYAMGKPGITTSVGVAWDFLEEGLEGAFIAPGDAGAMYDAMQQMLARREQWGEIGARNQGLAARFSGARMMAGYEDAYSRWLSEV